MQNTNVAPIAKSVNPTSNAINVQLANLPVVKAKLIPPSDIFSQVADDFKLLLMSSNAVTVPKEPVYIPDEDVFNIFLRWWSAKPVAPLAFQGPTGSGKTEICTYLCSKLGVPVHVLHCHPDLRADTLFTEKDVVVENGAPKTLVNPTDLLKAYAQGGLIQLDEFDKLNPECTAALHALTEYKPITTAIGVVYPHRFTKIVGTCNTVGDGTSNEYTSSMQLDMAFRSRFNFVTLNYPSKETEVAILKRQNEYKDIELLKKMVDVAHNLRVAKENGSLTLPFSTRTLVTWAHNMTILGVKATLRDSFKWTYSNGLEEEERSSANDVLNATVDILADESIEEIVKKL